MERTFEAALLGHVVRAQIVREVRREYLETVQQLEGDLPTQEHVQWKYSDRLCWPQHVLSGGTRPVEGSRDGRAAGAVACSDSCSDKEEHTDGEEEEEEVVVEEEEEEVKKEEEEKILLQTVAREEEEEEKSALEVDGDSTLSENLSDCVGNEQVTVNCEHSPPPSPPPPHPPLPQDREGLLKLRSQLVMELVWVKQAIASRQKYLMLKKKMEEEEEQERA